MSCFLTRWYAADLRLLIAFTSESTGLLAAGLAGAGGAGGVASATSAPSSGVGSTGALPLSMLLTGEVLGASSISFKYVSVVHRRSLLNGRDG